jgi:hypothetical protein
VELSGRDGGQGEACVLGGRLIAPRTGCVSAHAFVPLRRRVEE